MNVQYDKLAKTIKAGRNNMMLYSIASVIIGVIAMIAPSTFYNIISYVIAGILCAFGLYSVITYFSQGVSDAFGSFGLVKGTAFLGFGVLLFIKPDFIVTTFGLILGIALIIDGVIKVQYSVDLFRAKYEKWWYLLIPGALILLLGLIFITANDDGRGFTVFLGITLVVDGVTDLFTYIFLSRFAKKGGEAETALVEVKEQE